MNDGSNSFDDIVGGQFDDVDVSSLDLDLMSDDDLRNQGQAVAHAMLRRVIHKGAGAASQAFEKPIDCVAFFAGMIYGSIGTQMDRDDMVEVYESQADLFSTLGFVGELPA